MRKNVLLPVETNSVQLFFLLRRLSSKVGDTNGYSFTSNTDSDDFS